MTKIEDVLMSMQDVSYRTFVSKLLPTVDPEKIIGIRTPVLRAYAAKICGSAEAEAFLRTLPHAYLEENHLHSFLIEKIKDFNVCIAETERFLPFVDNWATCDSMRPKCFAKNPNLLLPHLEAWLTSAHCYTVRYGIEMLMLYFLDDRFQKYYADMVACVQSEEYYVNMMISWYFATALAKQFEAVVPYLTENRLSTWVHNKTIQKAIESYRIAPEQKLFLRSLRRKN